MSPDDVPGPGEDAEGPIDVVASVGALDAIVVLLRDFLHRAGAVRAIALVATGDAEGPVVIDCGRLLPVEVRWPDHVVHLPTRSSSPPRPPLSRTSSRCRASRWTGTRARSPRRSGGLSTTRVAVKSLAAILGGDNVALVTFETTDPETPLSVSARGDDPIVLSLGDEQFEMDPGWP